MAAARDVWSFSMSLLRWREGDYGLYGAMKPYITLLSPSVRLCVCVRRRWHSLTVFRIIKLNVKPQLWSGLCRLCDTLKAPVILPPTTESTEHLVILKPNFLQLSYGPYIERRCLKRNKKSQDWCLQIASFVQPKFQNTKTLHLPSLMTNLHL